MLRLIARNTVRSGLAELLVAVGLAVLAALSLPDGVSWVTVLCSFASLLIFLKLSFFRVRDFFFRVESTEFDDVQSAMTTLYRERQQLARQVDELATVREVALAVGSILDFNEMIRAILDLVTTHFGIAKAFIYLRSQDEQWYQVVGARAHGQDIPVARVLQKKVAAGKGLIGRAASELREIVETHPERGVIAAVPLVARDRVVGVLKLADPDPALLDSTLCRKLHAVAGAIAVALENSRLYRLAVTDGLTGLYVHRHFQHRLEEEFQRSRRYATPLALLLTDIDHFKKFNDTYGHQTGDVVLQGVARVLSEEARSTDVVCRYGGEEMALILPETDHEGACRLAERIRRRIADRSFSDAEGKGSLQVTISIGVVVFDETVEKRATLIERADTALYAAKHGGRNRVEVWTPPKEQTGAA